MKQAEKVTAWIIGLTAIFLTAVVLWWALGSSAILSVQKLGLAGTALSSPFVWVAALVIALGYIAYTAIVVPLVRKNVLRFSWLKVLAIWDAVVTGVVEEVVFRQMLMDWLMSRGINVVLQILISGAIFGVAHALWALLGGNWKIAIPVVASTFILGVLLGTLYVFADRSALPCIAAHATINLGIEPWLMLSVVSEGEKEQAAGN